MNFLNFIAKVIFDVDDRKLNTETICNPQSQIVIVFEREKRL